MIQLCSVIFCLEQHDKSKTHSLGLTRCDSPSDLKSGAITVPLFLVLQHEEVERVNKVRRTGNAKS